MKEIQVIKTNGVVRRLDNVPSLKEMQAIVGGYVEHVKVLDRVADGKPVYTSMFVNEEGMIKGLRRNNKATAIYQKDIRMQYPAAANPFRAAEAEARARYGDTIIDTRTDEYRDDPYIVGDVIFFQGYTCEEVDELF